jgi:transposase
VHLGPPLVFEKLWQQLGMPDILRRLLAGRRFEFPVDAWCLTVLHRLFGPGSDRAAERWCRRYALGDIDDLSCTTFYRTMGGWASHLLTSSPQTSRGRDCERLHRGSSCSARRRDLFTGLRLVFIDTTSLYFEGQGGETIGQRGYSKDHRPDLKQMIVVVVTDDEGRPVCCELLPGNTVDVTLLSVVDRLRARFDIREVCVVGDRGMISKKTISELSQRGIHYILGRTIGE